MFCTKCGKQIADGSSFCTYCGNKVQPRKPSPAPAQSSEPSPVPAPAPEKKPASVKKKEKKSKAPLIIALVLAVLLLLAAAAAAVYFIILPKFFSNTDASGGDDYAAVSSEGTDTPEQTGVEPNNEKTGAPEAGAASAEEKEETAAGSEETVFIQETAELSGNDFRKMQEKAESVFSESSDRWGRDETLLELTCIGYYFLASDEMDEDRDGNNFLSLVYKARVKNYYANNGKTYDKTNEYCWFIGFSDLKKTADGETVIDLKNYYVPSDSFTISSGIPNSSGNTKTWTYYGYRTLDELYNGVINVLPTGSYYVEEEIDESLAPLSEDPQEETEEGIIFPNSSDEYIYEEDLRDLSDEELQSAINEIYARNGYIFNSDEIRAFYEQYDWYEPRIKPESFTLSLFNEVEKANLDVMQKERNRRK